MNPEKVQLIQPPITIMGSMLVNIPFIMSNAMLGSVGEERENTAYMMVGAHSAIYRYYNLMTFTSCIDAKRSLLIGQSILTDHAYTVPLTSHCTERVGSVPLFLFKVPTLRMVEEMLPHKKRLMEKEKQEQ